jgi:hypothetical protein
MIKVYYGPKDNISDEFRLLPAPLISINTKYNYSNDNIIGYSYIINLNGYVTNYRRPDNLSEQNNNNDNQIRNITKVLENLEITKNILSYTGGCLTVVDENDNILLLALGGSVKSLNFDSSDNRMTSYSKFTCEIEFNELSIGNETFGCSASYINNNSIPNSDLIDINKYKVKEFSDNWSLDVGDESFNFVANSDSGGVLRVNNTVINVTYSISATAKDFVTYDNSGQSLLSPGWIQAKNFIQDRIYKQVSQLDKILKLSSGTTCTTSAKLNQIHSYGDGVYKQLNSSYKFYNELISFEASETDGFFSATYTSILKLDNDDSFSSSNVIHTFSKEINVNNNVSGPDQTSIIISGEIKGLIEGGLIDNPGTLSFGQSGSILIKANNNSVKFNNANAFINKIIIGNDLTSSFKNALGINSTDLNILGCGSNIVPSSFSLTKNFMEGIITYNVSYNSSRACGITRTTVTVDNPEDIYNELILPDNRYVIQFLNTKTAKKINVNIEGLTNRNCCSLNTFTLPAITIPDIPNSILKEKSLNYNPITGSYRASIVYVCGNRCGVAYV